MTFDDEKSLAPVSKFDPVWQSRTSTDPVELGSSTGHIKRGWSDVSISPPRSGLFEKGEKTPTPKNSALLRKRPVLLRAKFVLTKDQKRSYYGHFCVKMRRVGSCSKAAGGP